MNKEDLALLYRAAIYATKADIYKKDPYSSHVPGCVVINSDGTIVVQVLAEIEDSYEIVDYFNYA